MQQLPEDINMLFSLINMRLRDEYANLDDLCGAMDIDKKWLTDKLSAAGFEYNEQKNKFW